MPNTHKQHPFGMSKGMKLLIMFLRLNSEMIFFAKALEKANFSLIYRSASPNSEFCIEKKKFKKLKKRNAFLFSRICLLDRVDRHRSAINRQIADHQFSLCSSRNSRINLKIVFKNKKKDSEENRCKHFRWLGMYYLPHNEKQRFDRPFNWFLSQ